MNQLAPQQNNKFYNQQLLAGCTILLILFFFIFMFGIVYSLKWDREAVHYPGAILVSAHNNYSHLPVAYRWDQSFRTDDPFTAVYNWYSIKFNMGAEVQANGACIRLETADTVYRLQKAMNVFICGTPQGQIIFVSRATSFK